MIGKGQEAKRAVSVSLVAGPGSDGGLHCNVSGGLGAG